MVRPSVVRLFTCHCLIRLDYYRFPHKIEDENIQCEFTNWRTPFDNILFVNSYLSWSPIFDVADRIGRGLSVDLRLRFLPPITPGFTSDECTTNSKQ